MIDPARLPGPPPWRDRGPLRRLPADTQDGAVVAAIVLPCAAAWAVIFGAVIAASANRLGWPVTALFLLGVLAAVVVAGALAQRAKIRERTTPCPSCSHTISTCTRARTAGRVVPLRPVTRSPR